MTEWCPRCQEDTEQEVWIDIITESKYDNKRYSREPYRFTECVECGLERKQRMSNA